MDAHNNITFTRLSEATVASFSNETKFIPPPKNTSQGSRKERARKAPLRPREGDLVDPVVDALHVLFAGQRRRDCDERALVDSHRAGGAPPHHEPDPLLLPASIFVPRFRRCVFGVEIHFSFF